MKCLICKEYHCDCKCTRYHFWKKIELQKILTIDRDDVIELQKDSIKELEKQIEILRKVNKICWEEMNRMKDIIKRASNAHSWDEADNILTGDVV